MGGEVNGAAELRAAIRERAERRVDVVKVMVSGGVATGGTDIMGCQFSLEDLCLVVHGAHAAGLPVTAHAHGLPAVEQAIEAGMDGAASALARADSARAMTPICFSSTVTRYATFERWAAQRR